MRRASIFLIAFACVPLFGLAADAKPVKKFELQPCTNIPGLPPEARCGTYEVWETLLLSGERDPVTPPGNAERAARTLQNSLHVVVPDGGHSYAGIEGANECVDGLIVQLVETGRVKGLDTTCAARAKRPQFALKRDPEVELPADQLARLAGSYKDRESGYEIRIEPVGHRLRAVEVGEGSALVLVATSPTRFRIEGMADTATFQLSEGRATTVILEAPGEPSLTLKREGS